MASYPNLPDNRLIVNGVDLSIAYNLVLLDGYTLSPPEPKTYTVDIPGGNGVIDLTESLTGDVSYKNRNQEFTFDVIYPDDFERVKTKLSNFLHGKFYDYTMTMDPGYTYHGRFTVESYSHAAYTGGLLGQIKIKIEAKPYKTKSAMVYKLNATGGKLYRFESGRRKVHPVIECTETCFITSLPDGDQQTVLAGTYRLNNILFNEGFNQCWINSKKFYDITWEEISEVGKFASKWSDLSTTRWDEIQLLGQKESDIVRAWSDLKSLTWSDLTNFSGTPISNVTRTITNGAYYKLPILNRDMDESSSLTDKGYLSLITLDDEDDSHHYDSYSWSTWKLTDFVDFTGVMYNELTDISIGLTIQPPVRAFQGSNAYIIISTNVPEYFTDFDVIAKDETSPNNLTVARKLSISISKDWTTMQQLYVSIGVKIPYSSSTNEYFTFTDLKYTLSSVYPYKRWYDFNWKKNVVGDSTVYLTYDWEDL